MSSGDIEMKSPPSNFFTHSEITLSQIAVKRTAN